jgi:hypothetical protein
MTETVRKRVSKFTFQLLEETWQRTTSGKWRLSHDFIYVGNNQENQITTTINSRDGRFIIYLRNTMPELLLMYQTLIKIAEILEVPFEGKSESFDIDKLLEKIKELKEEAKIN